MRRIITVLASVLLIFQTALPFLTFSEVSAADNALSFLTKDNGKSGFTLTVNGKENGTVTGTTDKVQTMYNFKFPNETKEYTFKLPNELTTVTPYTNQPLSGGVGTFDLNKDGTVTLKITKTGEGPSIYVDFQAESTINKEMDFTGGPIEVIVGDYKANLNVDFSKGQSILKTAAKDPNNVNNVIWTIDINTKLSSLKGVKVEDVLPAGLKITDVKIWPLKVKVTDTGVVSTIDSSTTVTPAPTISADKKTITFGDINKAYRIVYTTERTDKNLVASYENTAKLTANGTETSSSAKVDFKNTVDLKKAGDVTPIGDTGGTTTATYTVTINESQRTLPKGTVIKDVATSDIVDNKFKLTSINLIQVQPASLVEGIDYKVIPKDASNTKRGFNIELLKDTSEKITLTYNLDMSRDVGALTTNSKTVTNEVSVTLPGEDTANNKVTNKEEVITGTTYALSKEIVNIDYAKNQATFQLKIPVYDTGEKIVIKDNASSNLIVDLSTIKVYEYPLNTTTELNANNGTLVSGLKAADRTGNLTNIYLYKEGSTTNEGYYLITYTATFNADKDGMPYVYNNASVFSATSNSYLTQNIQSAKWFPEAVLKNGYKKATLVNNEDGTYKEIQYEAGVNFNQHDLTGAIVKDQLEGSQTYDPSSFKLYKLNIAANGTYTTGAEVTDANWAAVKSTIGTTNFAIPMDQLLPQTADKNGAYVIKYSATVNDVIGDTPFKNSVQVAYNETVSKDIGTSKNQPNVVVTNPPLLGEHIDKEGAQEGSLAHWKVDINAANSKLTKATVSDELSEGHTLLSNSFKLYHAVIDKNTLKTTGDPLVEGQDYTLTFTEKGYVLTFKDESIHTPYVLTYDSYLTGPSGSVIKNDVKISAEEQIPSKESTVKEIAISSASGSGYPTNGKETSSVKIKKIDGETKEPLAGVSFELSFIDTAVSADELIIRTAKTDENGIAEFKDIPLTSISTITSMMVKEVEAAEGYKLNSEAFDVQLLSKETAFELEVPNYKDGYDSGKITINKVDRYDNDKKLQGAKFQLLKKDATSYEKDGEAYVVETNSEGVATFEGIPAGEYIVEEITAPASYVLPDSSARKTPVTVSFNATTKTYTGEVTIENEPEKGSLQIVKVDKKDSTKKLEGATFTVTGPDDFEEIVTTDKDGIVLLEELVPGEYTVEETDAPEGYVLDDTQQTKVVESNQLATLQITNEEAIGKVTLTKYDIDTDKVLAGATFKLVDADGTVVKKDLVTNEKGQITVEVAYGDYEFIETKAPTGYVLDEEPIETIVDEATVQVYAYNEKTKSTVTPPTKDDGKENPPTKDDGGKTPSTENNNGSKDQTPSSKDDTTNKSNTSNHQTSGDGSSNGSENSTSSTNHEASNSGKNGSAALPQTGEMNSFWLNVGGAVFLMGALLLLFLRKKKVS